MILSAKDIRILAPAFLFFIILNILSFNFPFFWDTILYSKIAHWLLENDFSSLALPQVLDTGNQPFFEVLLALGWKISGRALWVGHLLVLPFLLGIVVQYFFLARRYVPPQYLSLSLLFLMLEPTMLAQSTMVSLEIPILFFYLLGLNAMLSERKYLLILATAGLALTNLRGAALVSALVLTDALIRKDLPFRRFLYYLPSAMLLSGWLLYHYIHSGWFLSQPDEWAEHRQLLGAGGMLKNLFFIAWRFFDFGKFALFAFTGVIILYRLRNKAFFARPERELILISLMPFAVLAFLFLPFSNPIGHRYFLPVYLLLLPLACCQLQFIADKTRRLILYTLFGLSLLAGHLFTYPPPLANGWDSFITHLLYFPARDKMTGYITSAGIDPEEVGTDFPLNSSYKYTNLREQDLEFSNKYFGGIGKYPYVIQSNINNRFYREELETLERKWLLIKEYRKGPVYLRLYKNPDLRKNY